jgi:hypothetical protein
MRSRAGIEKPAGMPSAGFRAGEERRIHVLAATRLRQLDDL